MSLLITELLKNMILSAKPHINSKDYGYGFFVKNNNIFHGGDGTGISANITYFLRSDCIICVLSNYSNPSANNIISLWEKYQ